MRWLVRWQFYSYNNQVLFVTYTYLGVVYAILYFNKIIQ